MGTAIIVLLIVIVALLVVALVLLSRRAKATSATPEAPVDPFNTQDVDSLRGDPREIGPGSIIEIRGTTYAVRGSLHLDEDGWTWAEHLLDDSKGNQVWLSVEEDPDLELALSDKIDGSDLQPGAKKVLWNGREYKLDESGTAEFRGEGTTGLKPAGTVKYHDYEAAGGHQLSFENYGTKWEASAAEVLGRHEVQIYPTAP